MQVGRLVKELPRKAELVGEDAHCGAIAEGVRVPLPHESAEKQNCLAGQLTQTPQTGNALNQPQALQARVAVLADDQMIMHGDF